MEPNSRTYFLCDRFYPSVCVDDAIAQFHSLCTIRRSPAGSGTEIAIILRPGAPKETPEEFMNFLLCASLEKLLA